MKPYLFLDIDGTLFDPNLADSSIEHKLAHFLGIPFTDLQAITKSYTDTLIVSSDFNLRMYLSILARMFKVDETLLENIFRDRGTHARSVYEDAILALPALARQFKLGIFSEGMVLNQRAKLASTFLGQYFDNQHTLIFSRKLDSSSLKRLPNCCIVVDNSLEVIETLAKKKPSIFTFWINRNGHASDRVYNTVKSLNELLNLAVPI